MYVHDKEGKANVYAHMYMYMYLVSYRYVLCQSTVCVHVIVKAQKEVL